MNVSGFVTHPTASAQMTIYVVFDNGESLFVVLGTKLAANTNFVYSFQPSASPILPGDHKFTFYAVDGAGCVSPGVDLSVALKVMPVRAEWSTTQDFCFNVFGMAGSVPVQITSGGKGFQVQGRSGGGTHMGWLTGGDRLIKEVRSLEPRLTQLGDSAVLVCLKFGLTVSMNQDHHLSVSADLFVDGTDEVSITSYMMDGRVRAYYIEGRTYGFTIISNGYPLLARPCESGETCGAQSNGYYGAPRADYYALPIVGGSYSGKARVAFSWLVYIGPHYASVGLIVRSGRFDPIQPVFVLIGSDAGITLRSSDSLRLSGSISNAVECDLIMVINGDITGGIVTLSGPFGSSYSIDLKLSSRGIGIGTYRLTFHAVDRIYSRVSDGRRVQLTVINAASLIPISWVPLQAGFEVFGVNPARETINTTGGRGYAPSIRVDQGTASGRGVVSGWGGSHNGLDLRLNLTMIGEHAVLIGFLWRNRDSNRKTLDVACEANLLIDGVEAASCSQVSGTRGFYMAGTRYGFTVITGTYGFVTDTSSYWYGAQGSLSSSYWSQVPAGTYAGNAGCVWSWHNRAVPGYGNGTACVIMRSGGFLEGGPTLLMPTSAIPVAVLPSSVVHLSGTITDLRVVTMFGLWLIMDEDSSNIQILLNEAGQGPFEYDLNLSEYNLSVGAHRF
jgi:hypothetical protein